MEKYTMLMDWKNQYSENEYTTQSNLQIQLFLPSLKPVSLLAKVPGPREDAYWLMLHP